MDLGELVQDIYHTSFNVKFALISAYINGPIAGAVNISHGPMQALAAAGTQGVSSFLSTGITARIVQHFSPIKDPLISYFWGSLIPACVTFMMSYTAHRLNHTPETLESCVVPTAISYTTSYVTNYITRRGYLRPANYPEES